MLSSLLSLSLGSWQVPGYLEELYILSFTISNNSKYTFVRNFQFNTISYTKEMQHLLQFWGLGIKKVKKVL